MSRAALYLSLPICLCLGACGFPDYGFAPAGAHGSDAGPDGGGNAPGTDARANGGRSGGGGASGGGIGGGTGGATPTDAQPDAPAGCSGDVDCAGAPESPHCDPTDRTCVECRPGGVDCAVGTRCTGGRRCEPGCDTSGDCVGAGSSRPPPRSDASAPDAASKDASGPSLDAASGTRDAGRDARSTDGAARDAAALVCDLVTHTCVGCEHDSDCPLGMLCTQETTRCEPGCTSGRPCPTGFDCCSGECVNLSITTTHCGVCDVSCALEGGLGACVGGACRSTTCQAEFGDCNQDPKDGCETPLSGDPNNCGRCGSVCNAPATAAASCTAGVCGVGACLSGFADCDRDPADACEKNLNSNTANCGSCGFACNLLHANPRCALGACQIASCRAGFANCDHLDSTGCEVDTLTDPSNCGKDNLACGNVCAFPNADATCKAGVCTLGTCHLDTLNCNGMATDGCEVSTSSDVNNCGGCLQVCALAHASAGCSEGSCKVVSCDTGWGDCNGDPKDGCETNLDTSATSCGACGQGCSANHGAPKCTNGSCSIMCAIGFESCDADVSNGCETSTATNVEHCGSCTNVCSTMGGVPNCVAGVCGVSACTGTRADCNASSGDGCEVDTSSDVKNCDGCGKACFVANGTAACTGSVCSIASCSAGFGACDVDPGNGCETRLNTTTHCGACNKACSLAHASATCVTGACAIGFCITPWADCDGNAANGCETDTSKDVKNCGGCGDACNATNGAPKCTNGSCAITCNAGFGNCNAILSDGCERATKNDVANCGACGAVCAVQNGSPACVGTTCSVASCSSPFADCDHLYASGCEVNTDTRIDNCGACGKACDTSRGTPTCAAGLCTP